MAGSFRPLAERNGIDYEILCPAEHLHTSCDHEKISAILSNLLSNAFKYTASGGRITLRIQIQTPASEAQEHKAIICINVQDTGIGIPEESLPHIFTRFYQAKKVETAPRARTGIGLALVKELVDLHHGDIFVESTVGVGTHFTAHIPVGKDRTDTNERDA